MDDVWVSYCREILSFCVDSGITRLIADGIVFY